MTSPNPPTSGTLGRSTDRPKSAPLMKIGMVLFGIGLVAIAVDFAMFASGSRDLPLWLNLVCLLTVVGFGIGLVGVVREAKAASRPARHVSSAVNTDS